MSYSLIPARMHFEDARCADGCSVAASTAAGDGYDYPYIDDAVAEPSDAPTGTFSSRTHRRVPGWPGRVGREG